MPAEVPEGMSEEEFRRSLHAKLKSSGVLGTVKVCARSQTLKVGPSNGASSAPELNSGF